MLTTTSLVALSFTLLPAASPVPGDGTPEWGGFRGNNGVGLARAADGARIPDRLDPEATALCRRATPRRSSPGSASS